MRPSLLGLIALTLPPSSDALTALDVRAGWRPLFDGVSLAGWRSVRGDEVAPEGWSVVGGALHQEGGGADLVTTGTYAEFELEFQWRLSEGGNSGVKYLVPPHDAPSAVGPEYQLLDDSRHPDGTRASHRAASLYDLVPAELATPPEPGVFHSARIVSRDGWIEHGLDGALVLRVDTASPRWRTLLEASKFSDTPSFARAGRGWIALQDHGDEVWFRDLALRELPAGGAPEVDLLGGDGLASWHAFGDAIYEREDRTLLGKVGGGSQSFLVSDVILADFVLEVDVRAELPGNSGIQIRCHEREDGRPFGYQIEIDPSERSWSGGLYDEARRGWLQSLAENPAGRAAFDRHGWNRYRIECVGPRLRAWVNGVPTVDRLDLADHEGSIGLQVHSGDDTCVRWRDLRAWDLGRHVWVPVALCACQESPCVRGSEVSHSGTRGAWTVRFGDRGGWLALPDFADGSALRCELELACPTTLRCGEWSLELPNPAEGQALALGVCRDGARFAAFVDGRLVADLYLEEPSAPVELGLAGPGALMLRELEALRPAR